MAHYGIGLLARTVVNLMKVADRLTTLGLSFAFIGISGAHVVAAALRIDSYATLTRLNLRANRLKTAGARAILSALQRNARLTDVDLSRNEIQRGILSDLSSLFSVNRVLMSLDISQNPIFLLGEFDADQQQHQEEQEHEQLVRELLRCVMNHKALRSLGDLNRYVACLLSGFA